MASRRSLTTTTAAAGALLAALCFVPSASASVGHPAHSGARGAQAAPVARSAHRTARPASSATENLADTGSIDTTPYAVGGTTFLGMGAALLLFSRRRALMFG